MAVEVYLGEPFAKVKQWIVDHTRVFNDKLKFVVETTANYKKSGIYSAQRDDVDKPVIIDWGDGTIEEVDGDLFQKDHEYASAGVFNVVVENVKSYAASGQSTWTYTTSQNQYTLKEVVAMPDGVTEIEGYAFFNCGVLTSVAIGNGVSSIGSNAFRACNSLSSVAIPDDVTCVESQAFYNCSALTSVTMGGGMTSIGDEAFFNCTGLTGVTIPDGVKDIGYTAFRGCNSLTSVMIPGSVENIDSYAFSNCKGLTDVTIGHGVTKIAGSMFKNCQSLSSVTIPSSVTSINDGAFGNCYSLTNMTIPDGVTSIESQAFYGSGLANVIIPNSVTSIKEQAFYNTPFYNNQPDGPVIFNNKVLYEYKGTAPASYQVPDGIVSITRLDNYTLENISIPASVSAIQATAFSNAYSLKSITFAGKTISEVQGMENYNFEIGVGRHPVDPTTPITISCTNGSFQIQWEVDD